MTALPSPTSRPVRLFSTDLDGTLLGNPESTRRFKATWDSLPKRRHPLLVYNSGRTVDDVCNLVRDGAIPPPEYVIGSVGTEMYDFRNRRHLAEFEQVLVQGWDLEKVESIATSIPGIERQPPEFLHPYKSSWFLNHADRTQIEQIEQQFAQAGLEVKVVYSSSRHLDFLPKNATKGNALRWLCDRLEIALSEVLVAGDTGNDTSMFLLPDVRGIVVDNAQPELLEAVVEKPVYVARKILADGILDGFQHYGLIDEAPSLEATARQHQELDPGMRMLFTGAAMGGLTDAERQFVNTAFEKAIEAVRRNITPMGFAACSIPDNEATGTDANYHSIWARDGAITLIGTLDLPDADIRQAQRKTLETLLDHISVTGQIPANVRIDGATPDYSGVGNICAIDSGLWVIIAFFNYVSKTGDIDFLRHYAQPLQAAMNWMTAHDSNNDGLLEVPEAGDWTDLFGRSYNVLYDEVLWYRANICFGRMLEMLEDFPRAADYLRWSQVIRGKILDAFWPTTKTMENGKKPGFSESQFALGDAQYLLAEITPFAFNWRCDVFGNVLAFLTNLLDIDRARVAFRFMWGVGVNEPFPVANLYPVVQSGDPDWRAYYTVNLLNLPNHYHNGGIWPFVGGMWVRFIHRLGLHEVAARELVRLAELNRLGKTHEWEFNEWAHGRTGRPMGKAFQAWSAASFIRACQELQLSPKEYVHD